MSVNREIPFPGFRDLLNIDCFELDRFANQYEKNKGSREQRFKGRWGSNPQTPLTLCSLDPCMFHLLSNRSILGTLLGW